MVLVSSVRYLINPSWCSKALLSHLSKTSIVSVPARQQEKHDARRTTEFIIKRTVHYKPYVCESSDRKQHEVFKKFGITSSDIDQCPGLLNIHPQTLEHHGLVLLEGGFERVTASNILNYFRIVKKKISLLKLHKYIKAETNVVNSFLNHLGNFPTDQELELNADECQYIDVYNKILKQYLVWRLNTTPSEVDRILKTYQRIKHRSLKYMAWSLDILENDLEFSKEKILRHGYLIHSYPYNTLDTLQRLPQLCGKEIKTVFHQYPKIIMTVTNTLLQTAQHLKDYGIPDEAVQRCFEVFTLGSDSMRHRLQQLKTMPELRPFADSPHALKVVHYQHKVSARIDQLHELQRQCASLHVLCSDQAYFERYTREGEDRSRGRHIINFLAQKLNTDELKIRNYLQRHPFWCNVSVVSIQNTFEYLLQRGFKKQSIINNVHILLYPRDHVDRILSGLSTNHLLIEAQQITKMTYKSVDQNPKHVSVENELALCLYFLERHHHFTGNGVWNTAEKS